MIMNSKVQDDPGGCSHEKSETEDRDMEKNMPEKAAYQGHYPMDETYRKLMELAADRGGICHDA